MAVSYDTELVVLAFAYASAAVDSRAGSMVPAAAEVLHSRMQKGTGVMQEVQGRDVQGIGPRIDVELIDSRLPHRRGAQTG